MATTLTSYLGNTTDFGTQSASPVIPPYYADFLRMNLYPSLYFRQLGTKVTIPQGYGDKIKIPRWSTPVRTSESQAVLSSHGGAPTAINEATAGADITAITLQTLCAGEITGQTIQFVGGRGYSDKLILITRANFVEGALESLARELAFRLDRYSRTNISSSGFVTNAGSGVAAGSADVLRGKEIAKIGPRMDSNNVPRWEDNHFVGVAHPLAQYDVYSDISATGFVPIYRYNSATNIYRGEIGALYGIRLVLSNAVPINVSTDATSATVGLSSDVSGAQVFTFAPDAFYSIEQENGGVEVIHHPPGSGGSTGDPGNLLGSISVKVHYGVAVAPSADKRLQLFSHALGLTHQ